MPGARIDYRQEVGQQRARDIIAKKKDDVATVLPEDGTGCMLFGGSTNNDGYGQVFAKRNSDLNRTGRAAQTAFLIHRLAYLARTGQDCVNHGSHLCGRRNCFNPDHVVDESAQENNARKGCAGNLICGFHHHIIVDLCTHMPRCIRPERFDVSCCLALRESDPEGWASQSTTAAPSSEMDESSQDAPGELTERGNLLAPPSMTLGELPDQSRPASAHSSSDYGSFPSEV